MTDPRTLVDLERYPLFAAAGRRQVVDDARATLESVGAAILPGFIHADGVASLAAEAVGLAPIAYRREQMLGAYGYASSSESDPTHPTRRTSRYTMHAIATDQLAPAGPTMSIYEWQPLIDLIAEILDLPELYVLDDSMMRCNLTYLSDGDEHGWHFDGNDFVVSLLLQSSESGGAFEFAPNIATETEPNYDAVRAVMDEQPGMTQILQLEPGTLALFRGRRALHRVTRVHGDRQRIIALLSYHETPGLVNGPDAQLRVFGRVAATT